MLASPTWPSSYLHKAEQRSASADPPFYFLIFTDRRGRSGDDAKFEDREEARLGEREGQRTSKIDSCSVDKSELGCTVGLCKLGFF